MSINISPCSPWFQEHYNYLLYCLTNNCLPQAIMLRGASDLGKYDFAVQFAEKILGRSVDNHPDYYYLANNSIDSVREIISNLQTSSLFGGYKVCIINNFEKLNLASLQALLKPIEEPSDNTIFILIAQNNANILPTILSRVICLDITVPSIPDSLAWLQQFDYEYKYNLENFETSLLLTNNKPKLALELLQDPDKFNLIKNTRRTVLLSIFKIKHKNSGLSQLSGLSELSELLRIFDLNKTQIIIWIYLLILDCLKIKFSLNIKNIKNIKFYNSDFKIEINCMAANMEINKLFNFANKLMELNQALNSMPQLDGKLLFKNLINANLI